MGVEFGGLCNVKFGGWYGGKSTWRVGATWPRRRCMSVFCKKLSKVAHAGRCEQFASPRACVVNVEIDALARVRKVKVERIFCPYSAVYWCSVHESAL